MSLEKLTHVTFTMLADKESDKFILHWYHSLVYILLLRYRWYLNLYLEGLRTSSQLSTPEKTEQVSAQTCFGDCQLE